MPGALAVDDPSLELRSSGAAGVERRDADLADRVVIADQVGEGALSKIRISARRGT
jgi:hypothetical protein